MENGRQLKIQSELERERERERWSERGIESRDRRSEMENGKTLHTREKGKKTERDRLSAEFYIGPRDHSALTPSRKIMADGCACCSIFEFATIRAVLFVRFFFSASSVCLAVFVFPRTLRAKRKRASEDA